MKSVVDRAVGNRTAEGHVAALVHGTDEFKVAQGSFQLRVEMRKGLGVIPHVGAGAVAASGVGEAAFPAPHVAVLLPQYRGRFKNAEVGRDRIKHIGRQGGREEGFLELHGSRLQRFVVCFDVESDVAGVFPLRRVIRTPRRRCAGGDGAATGFALHIFSIGLCAFAEIAIGKMPGDDDDVGARGAGREASLEENGAAVAAGSIDAV